MTDESDNLFLKWISLSTVGVLTVPRTNLCEEYDHRKFKE